jgi:CrcB protein
VNDRLRVLLAVAAGGAAGAPARYEVTRLVAVAKAGFPGATFWINVSGSFLLGFLLVLLLERLPPTRYVRPMVATGFLGAYTTFSTFAVETDVLAKDGHAAMALAYVVASTAAGLVAALAGVVAARRLIPSTGVALERQRSAEGMITPTDFGRREGP